MVYTQTNLGWKPITVVKFEHEAKSLISECLSLANGSVYSLRTCGLAACLEYVSIPYDRNFSAHELLSKLVEMNGGVKNNEEECAPEFNEVFREKFMDILA